MTTVVNVRVKKDYRTDPECVYIGRKGGNRHFGNPFTHLEGTTAMVKVADREAAVNAFRDWMMGDAYPEIEPERRAWIWENLETLRGKKLACWCAPALCHGEVYVKLLEESQP